MTAPFRDSPEFLRLLAGEQQADLTRMALEIARDVHPGLDIDAQLARIDALADRCRRRCPTGADLRHVLGQINWVLYVEEGFRGNDEEYQDPRNSYLDQVLDRKLGIPISLSVLYLALADRLGLAMAGVNLPGHFVIRAQGDGETIFVDPFHEGAMLDRDGCRKLISARLGRSLDLPEAAFGPCSKAAIVVRMLRNLKAIFLQDGDFAMAEPVLRRLVALEGRDATHRRDLGLTCLRLDRPGEALDHLRAYLNSAASPSDAEDVQALVRAAERALAARN